MSRADPDADPFGLAGPWCGARGCTDPAAVVVDHPEHGKRTVCQSHAADYEVLNHV